MDAMQILVIILASFLALFLILAVVLIVLLIKVTKQIKTVTSTAQNAVEHIGTITANVSKVTSPALLGKLILSQIKKFRK